MVDMYSKIETNNLNYLRDNQKQLKSDLYQDVYECIENESEDLHSIGKRVILLASFTGGPRDNYKRFMDAIAIVRKHGKPCLFITVTCTPEWSEIRKSLLPNQTPADRPDLIA